MPGIIYLTAKLEDKLVITGLAVNTCARADDYWVISYSHSHSLHLIYMVAFTLVSQRSKLVLIWPVVRPSGVAKECMEYILVRSFSITTICRQPPNIL